MIGKWIRSFFNITDDSSWDTGERPDPPPAPQPEPDVSGLLDTISSKELLPVDLKPCIKKIYNKHFFQYIRTNQPQLNPNDAWIEIKESIDNYVNETMDAVADAVDSYIGWMESDLEDYAEGIFETWDGGMRSQRIEPDPNLPWNADNKDSVWDSDPCDENCLTCGTPIPNGKTCPKCDADPCGTCVEDDGLRSAGPEDKKENLVDWNVDKAW